MAERGLRKAKLRGRGRKRSAHKRGARRWLPTVLRAAAAGVGGEVGWIGGAGKVILDTNEGPGACHPSPVPGHARRRNGDGGPSGPRSIAPAQGSPWGASRGPGVGRGAESMSMGS